MSITTEQSVVSHEVILKAWKSAKAKSDQLWWLLHKATVNDRRRQRYRSDAAYRQNIRSQYLRKRKQRRSTNLDVAVKASEQ